MDDRSAERLNPDIAGRPTLIHGDSQLFFGGMGGLSENSVVSSKNTSHAISSAVIAPDASAPAASVVIVAQGGFGAVGAPTRRTVA